MYKNWNVDKQSNFVKSSDKINWLINLITSIRSTKVDLNISPGSFIDISTSELSSGKANIINDNLDLFKRLGRVSNVKKTVENKNSIKIVVDAETVILCFDKSLNLNEQKQKISNMLEDLNRKILSIKIKLKNKSFLQNAPKLIVVKEKTALKNYNIELKKLNSILNSIKN